MNRLFTCAIVLIFSFFLSGCHADEKQSAKIQKIIEEASEFEKDFADNQTSLFEIRNDAQAVYNDLISLDIKDKKSVNKKIDNANTYIDKQSDLLEKAEENFRKAYKKTIKIEKNIKKMNNDDLKKQATELVTIMNERKRLIDNFFKLYHENLESQNSFYGYLKEEEFSLKELDEQINEINKRNQDMADIVQRFNQFSKEYIEVQKEYFN